MCVCMYAYIYSTGPPVERGTARGRDCRAAIAARPQSHPSGIYLFTYLSVYRSIYACRYVNHYVCMPVCMYVHHLWREAQREDGLAPRRLQHAGIYTYTYTYTYIYIYTYIYACRFVYHLWGKAQREDRLATRRLQHIGNRILPVSIYLSNYLSIFSIYPCM